MYSKVRLRKQILAERGSRCEWCGNTKTRIQLHHIVPYRFSLDNSKRNLLLLCIKCHGRADVLFLELAAKMFVAKKCPGLRSAISKLRPENTSLGV